MTAQEFLRDFQLLFIEKKVEAIAAYCSNKKFTTFVMNEIEDIIKAHDFMIQKEYFRIDAIGWSPRADLIEDTEDVHLSHHLWDLEVAVEHENDQRDWMDEVVKLAHIVCPLRVVIGSLPWMKRNGGPEFDMLNLKHVVKELKKLKCFENMAHGEFLVILGNCNTFENSNHYFGYKGYLYDAQSQSFLPLSE